MTPPPPRAHYTPMLLLDSFVFRIIPFLVVTDVVRQATISSTRAFEPWRLFRAGERFIRARAAR